MQQKFLKTIEITFKKIYNITIKNKGEKTWNLLKITGGVLLFLP